MAPNNPIRIIRLYAPSIDKTVEQFILKPSQFYSTILKTISKVLGIDKAWPYNLKREPVDDFRDVEAGRTLLIATCYFERPLPESVKDVLVVQPGAAEKAWMALETEKKREYIAKLEKDKVYLTLSRPEIEDRLASGFSPSFEACLEVIEEETWHLPLDAVLGFQGMFMPYGEIWEENLLPTLAILSEATLGQGMMVSALLIDEVKRNGGHVVQAAHVVKVGKRLFRKAEW
jgi:hypothetical protein